MDDELLSELDGYLAALSRELRRNLETRKAILVELERR